MHADCTLELRKALFHESGAFLGYSVKATDHSLVHGDVDFAAGGTMTMMAAGEVPAGTELVVKCRDAATSGNVTAQIQWRDLRIFAIRLGNLTFVPDLGDLIEEKAGG
jgi:hypothetical protein